MTAKDTQGDDREAEGLKSSDQKTESNASGEASSFMTDLNKRMQSSRAFQENTDARPTGIATNNFGRPEIFDGGDSVVKGAPAESAKLQAGGDGRHEEYAGSKDVDWVKELRKSTSDAATEKRIAEAINHLYKDNSPTGRAIQQGFEKWLPKVTDQDSVNLGLKGLDQDKLVERFNEELDKKPNTNCLVLATIIHEMRPKAEGE